LDLLDTVHIFIRSVLEMYRD